MSDDFSDDNDFVNDSNAGTKNIVDIENDFDEANSIESGICLDDKSVDSNFSNKVLITEVSTKKNIIAGSPKKINANPKPLPKLTNNSIKKKPNTAPMSQSQNAPVRPPLMRPSNIPAALKKSNTQRLQSGSILSFNPELPVHFTEKYTIQAIKNLGINEQELQYPTDVMLNSYSREASIKNMVREKRVKEVDDLIECVKKERESVIQKESNSNSEIDLRAEEIKAAFIQAEKDRNEKMAQKQAKEVEKLLYSILKEKRENDNEKIREMKEFEKKEKDDVDRQKKKKENEERDKKKMMEIDRIKKEKEEKEEQLKQIAYQKMMKSIENFEEDMKKRAQEAEMEQKIRMEKTQAAQLRIQSIQNEKARVLEEKRIQMEIKESERKEKEEEEKARVAEMRELYFASQRDHIEKIKEEQLLLAEKKLQDSIEKENRAFEKLKEFEQTRSQQMKEKSDRINAKMQKYSEKKKQIELEYQQKAEFLLQQAEEANLRYLDIELKKKQKISEASQGRDEHSRKIQEKLNQIQENELKRNEERVKQMLIQDEKMNRKREEQLLEFKKQSVESRLKLEQKIARVARNDKIREARKEQLKRMLDEKLKRIDDLQKLKQQMRSESDKHKLELEHERNTLIDQLQHVKSISSDSDMSSLKQLASKFGVDFDKVQDKVNTNGTIIEIPCDDFI